MRTRQKPAPRAPTVDALAEVERLEARVSRLRSALEGLRDAAGSMSVTALSSRPETTAAGVAYLGRLAADALERA